MSKKVLPEIDFEGKIVKPTKMGNYRCPYNCHRHGYTAPKWKTENGFRRHMEKCTGKPSYKNKLDQREIELIAKNQKFIDEFLVGHPIGSDIFIVSYVVTKPTHVQKFNRMVRVRYEEVRDYFAARVTINSVVPSRRNNNNFLINNSYWFGNIDLFETMDEAKQAALSKQKSYNKSCEEASSFR
jgi:hypothetical protein